HIIVTDSRSARDGRNIERVGYYNPVAQGAEQRIVLDTERVDHWVKQGAQLTGKVRNLSREASKAAPAACWPGCAPPSLREHERPGAPHPHGQEPRRAR